MNRGDRKTLADYGWLLTRAIAWRLTRAIVPVADATSYRLLLNLQSIRRHAEAVESILRILREDSGEVDSMVYRCVIRHSNENAGVVAIDVDVSVACDKAERRFQKLWPGDDWSLVLERVESTPSTVYAFHEDDSVPIIP